MDTENNTLPFGQENLVLADSDASLVRSQKKDWLLSRESEWQLIQQARGGDEQAFKKLLDAHLVMIRRTARLFATKGATNFIPLDDLIQEGILGLWAAVKRYDMRNDANFGMYAIQRIRGAMIDALRRNSPHSRHLVLSVRKARDIRVRLAHKLLREPTSSEWKNELPTNLQEKFEKLRAPQLESPQSLAQTDADGNEVAFDNILSVNDGRSTEDEVSAREEESVSKEFSSAIAQALTRLDWRQREIIFWRYQAPDGETCTELALSERLGISESRVCQLENQALATLRRYLRTCYRGEVMEELRKIARL